MQTSSSSKHGKSKNKNQHNESEKIKSSSNDNENTNYQNKIKTGNNTVTFYAGPNNAINQEIKSKIMSSNFCYVKQDLESFFSACLGCCADFFKYKVYLSSHKITEMDKIDGAIFRVNENEDCCMRTNFCCMKLCKPGSLYLHPLESDDLFGHFSFPCCTCCDCKCECCYCLGPAYSGYYGNDEGAKFGEMRHRSHWCSCVDICYETHRLFDLSDNSRFIIEKVCCQPGGIPCSTISGYYPLVFNILLDGNVVGTITRSAKACFCGPKIYFFEIAFPTVSTFEERMLLIGFTLREHYANYSQIINVVDNF